MTNSGGLLVSRRPRAPARGGSSGLRALEGKRTAADLGRISVLINVC